MPQRTVASGGGNFSSTATWVEAAVPGTGDFIVGDASSGQLTVNGNYSVQLANFSAYTNTITFNSGNTLTITSANTTTIFSSGTTFAGDGTLSFANATQTLDFRTTSRVPNLSVIGGTKTLSNNIYCINLSCGGSNSSFSYTGNRAIYISGNFTTTANAGFANTDINQDQGFIMDGTGNLNVASMEGRITFNTTGTTTFTGNFLGFFTTGVVKYTQGTLVNPRISFLTTSTNLSTSNFLNYASGVTWEQIALNLISTSGTLDVRLHQDLNVDVLVLANERSNSNEVVLFSQTGKLNVNDRFIVQANTGGLSEQADNELRLNTTGAHYVDKLFGLSQPYNKYRIRSTSAGVKATLNLGDDLNSPIFYFDFQDINASGGDLIETYNGTVSNCDNISSYSGNIFSSGGGGSFTFVN